MTVKQIIPAFPKLTWSWHNGDSHLNVSEFYFDTFQGEGIYTGHPAAFLRLQGCPLGCSYCDTTEVWQHGNPYSISELLASIGSSGLAEKLNRGQHLVITGGSPLLQQKELINFFIHFQSWFHFKPFVEIENECSIVPYSILSEYISCWNNSPKLTSSEVPFEKRYKPEIITSLAAFDNSWFKFVITKEEDWEEIENGFLMPGLIKKDQIILMPEGATGAEIELKRQMIVDLAIENNVRYSDRLHIIIWDKKVGI